MDTSPNLSLPYIAAAQAQKHVTHNEALRALDAIVQLTVLDKDLSAPPGSPTEGARYMVAPSPTGAWAGQADRIAAWQDGAWAFYAPREGWLAWVADEEELYIWSGTAWTAYGAGQLFVSSPTYPPSRIERTTGVTSIPVAGLQLLATTTGNMGDGFGINQDFAIQDNNLTINNIGTLHFARSGADNSGRFRVLPANVGTQTAQFEIAPSGNPYFPGAATTASASNAVLNSGSSPPNELLRSTSSARYKSVVEDLDPVHADNVLKLRPVWYRSSCPADDPTWSWYGLIAEEVAAIEPRLVCWGYAAGDYEIIERRVENKLVTERAVKRGTQPIPDGVAYDRVTVLLLSIVKRQEARIRALEANLS
jgi:Protein of unknown function (DUF2793)/Chaperone of endosialidase